jgi:hypothetical protein
VIVPIIDRRSSAFREFFNCMIRPVLLSSESVVIQRNSVKCNTKERFP